MTLIAASTAYATLPGDGGGGYSRFYHYHANIGGQNGDSDYVCHYHIFNQMYWSDANRQYLGSMNLTLCNGGPLWGTYHEFSGNALYQEQGAGSYYTYPVCANREYDSHYVEYCYTKWYIP